MKNDVLQGSVLSPMLLNIYISDLTETTSGKYGYADDLAYCDAILEGNGRDSQQRHHYPGRLPSELTSTA